MGVLGDIKRGLIPVVLGTFVALIFVAQCNGASLRILFEGDKRNPFSTRLVRAYEQSRHVSVTPIYMGLVGEVDEEERISGLAGKPDVYLGTTGYVTMNVGLGLFDDLQKVMPKKVLDGLHPGLLDSLRSGHKLFGIPIAGKSSVILFNPTLFRKAGLPRPTETWTWSDDFIRACSKLKADFDGDGKPDRYGMGANYLWDYSSLFYSYGGSFTDKEQHKVTYTGKSSMEAAQFILGIHRNGLAGIIDPSDPVSQGAFFSGKAAMLAALSSHHGDDLGNMGANGHDAQAGEQLMPRGPAGLIPDITSFEVSVFRAGRNHLQALDFVKFMAGEAGQNIIYSEGLGLPTSREGLGSVVKGNLFEINPVFTQGYWNGKSVVQAPRVQRVTYMFWNDLTDVITGKSTMQTLYNHALGAATQALSPKS